MIEMGRCGALKMWRGPMTIKGVLHPEHALRRASDDREL
jgi:hypothetical protein